MYAYVYVYIYIYIFLHILNAQILLNRNMIEYTMVSAAHTYHYQYQCRVYLLICCVVFEVNMGKLCNEATR